MSTYSADKVAAHIRRHHPGCPEFAVQFFAEEVARKPWKRASIGKAVGITMRNYLRHNMTRYESMLLEGIDRDEARRRVNPRIDTMLAVWKRSPGCSVSTDQAVQSSSDVVGHRPEVTE